MSWCGNGRASGSSRTWATGTAPRTRLPRTFSKDGHDVTKRLSAIQEMYQSRGHFALIGPACHAELAPKEHGWARLKAKVKPWVDGKIETLDKLLIDAMKEIGLKARLEDHRRCREVCAFPHRAV